MPEATHIHEHRAPGICKLAGPFYGHVDVVFAGHNATGHGQFLQGYRRKIFCEVKLIHIGRRYKKNRLDIAGDSAFCRLFQKPVDRSDHPQAVRHENGIRFQARHGFVKG